MQKQCGQFFGRTPRCRRIQSQKCGTLVNALLITRPFSGTSRAASALVAHDQREGWRSRSVREHAQSGTNRCLARWLGVVLRIPAFLRTPHLDKIAKLLDSLHDAALEETVRLEVGIVLLHEHVG